MLKKTIKILFYKLFNGVAFTARSQQLKGVKLKVDTLMPTFHFWRDVDIESHFIYDKFINDGFIIFDIGGNVGLHSYYFATRFKNSLVYAFEPVPENAAYIKKIVKLNNFKNITVVEKAVTTKSGTVYFDRDKNNHQGHISEAPSNLSVAATSLDDFIRQNLKPDFIKVDVEGFEADVLQGFQESISAAQPFLIIELHTAEQSKRVADFFRPLDYSVYRLEYHYEWDQCNPLTELDNPVSNINAPEGFWGTIVAIPSGKIHLHQQLFNSKVKSQK